MVPQWHAPSILMSASFGFAGRSLRSRSRETVISASCLEGPPATVRRPLCARRHGTLSSAHASRWCTFFLERQRACRKSMKPTRRQFLHLAAGAGAVPAVSRNTWAQTYPARPVRIIVGYPSGGSNDILARLMAQWLSERMGQQFVIENRPGAGSNIATEAVVRADPDGYTLLMVSTANMSNAALYEKLNYNFIRDIAPVAGVMRVPLVMEVNPSIPAKTVPEFIAYAKANPGTINFAPGGIGTSIHLSGELLNMMTGIV